MHTEVLKYEMNGLKMESVLYFDQTKTGKRAAVLVFPEAYGLGAHAKEKAQRLAELGYVTLASDLYGEGKNASALEEAMAFVGPMIKDPLINRAYAEGGLQALIARPEVDASRIAAIGYCSAAPSRWNWRAAGPTSRVSLVFTAASAQSGLGTPRTSRARCWFASAAMTR